LVDTQGFVLKVHVHPAHESDNQGGQALLERLGKTFTRLRHLWTDTGYKEAFREWVNTPLGWSVACVKRPVESRGEYAQLLQDFLGAAAYAQRYPQGFYVLPRRWVVERAFAWLSFQRRLSREYDLLPATTEAWMYLAGTRLLGKRLVKLRC
jgi:putative transposase